jgi:hypothetical protein
MKRPTFGSLPNWWFRKCHLFTELKASEVGKGIASMKCLLALSILIDFKTRDVSVSISGLQELTGLSRPMVLTGLDRLKNLGIIRIDSSNYRNVYKILYVEGDEKWAKTPSMLLRKVLQDISNRGIAPFAALKIYIALLSLRYKDNLDVHVSHETIRDYTRLQPKQIRAGLDVLFSCSLIHLIPREEAGANRYQILGL